jgi:hypothetical protein
MIGVTIRDRPDTRKGAAVPTTNPPEQDTPPRPTEAVNRHDFGRALRALRTWSELTQKALEETHPALTDSTISNHERGVRLPRLEWLHAYVTQCLRQRHPAATREELSAEFDHWRAAWTRLERADTAPGPAILTQQAPTQHAPAPPAPPSRADDSQPAPAPPTAPGDQHGRRRAGWPRRRVVLIGGGTAAVVAAVVYATATGLFDNTPNTPAQFSGPTAPVVPVHASGQVENLRGVEGIDLDTNNRADQEAPGVDISFAATSTHLNAMANRVTFTVLPEAGAEQRQRCVTAVDWMRQIPTFTT